MFFLQTAISITLILLQCPANHGEMQPFSFNLKADPESLYKISCTLYARNATWVRLEEGGCTMFNWGWIPQQDNIRRYPREDVFIAKHWHNNFHDGRPDFCLHFNFKYICGVSKTYVCRALYSEVGKINITDSKQVHITFKACPKNTYKGDICDYNTCGPNCHFEKCDRQFQKCDCVTGFHARKCDRKCPASCGGGACDKITGACLQRCNGSFYGPKCATPCNCLDGASCSDNGFCQAGCALGYTGADCSQECDQGFYGSGCAKKCGSQCDIETCSKKTGECECETGFYGSSCTPCNKNCDIQTCSKITGECECERGFYGPSCTPCDKNCLIQTCSKITGECDCLPGYWGRGCIRNCSRKCRTQCNQVTGACPEQPTPPTTDHHHVTKTAVMSSSLTLVLLAICFGLVCLEQNPGTITPDMSTAPVAHSDLTF